MLGDFINDHVANEKKLTFGPALRCPALPDPRLDLHPSVIALCALIFVFIFVPCSIIISIINIIAIFIRIRRISLEFLSNFSWFASLT